MSEYRVDLSELDGVARRIKALQKDMDEPCTKVSYYTALPPGALGVNFSEADALYAAHDEMQTLMSDTLKALRDFIRDFGDKTERARGAYEDQEYETRKSMDG